METKPKNDVFLAEEIPAEINGVKLSESSKELLKKGEWSELLEGLWDDSSIKNAKIKLSRSSNDGTIKVNFKFQNEQLIIPERIGDYDLTSEDKIRLTNKEIAGPISLKGQELFLQVDSELNSVVIRSAKEIDVAKVIELKFQKNNKFEISGYSLSEKEVKDLCSGKELPTKVYKEGNTYFSAKISLTEDKKGVRFGEVLTIPNHRAQALINKLNTNISTLETISQAASGIINPQDVLKAKGEELQEEKTVKTETNISNDNPIIESVSSSGSTIVNQDKEIEASITNNEQTKQPEQTTLEIDNPIIESVSSSGSTIVNQDKEIEASIINNEQTKQPEQTTLEKPNYLGVDIYPNGSFEILCTDKDVNLTEKTIEKIHTDLTNYKELVFADISSSKDPDGANNGHKIIVNNSIKDNNIAFQAHIISVLDRNAVDYSNTPLTIVKENVEKYNNVSNEQISSNPTPKENKQQAEFYEAIEKRDFKKLNSLAGDGFKLSEKEIQHINAKLSDEDRSAIKTIFHIQPNEEVRLEDKSKQTRENEPKIAKENTPKGNQKEHDKTPEKVGGIAKAIAHDM